MNFLMMLPLPVKIGIVAALLAAAGVWHHSIYQAGYNACQAVQIEAVKKGEKLYEKTFIQTQRMSNDALRREFCRWVRDSDLPTCLKALPSFR